MPLETPQFLNSLVASNPAPGDTGAQGDDHLRLIKQVLLASFPGIAGAMTLTHDQINALPTSTKTYTDATVNAAISNEITARNTAIGNNIASEIANRNAAIQGEANARYAADVAEGNARAGVDASLQSQINNEATNRNNADAAIYAALGAYATLGAFGAYDAGNGYYRINLPGGIQIAMGYGLGVAHGAAVSYGCNFSNVFTIIVSDQSTNGVSVGAWKRDSNSMIVWCRDNAGNPVGTAINYLVIGTA